MQSLSMHLGCAMEQQMSLSLHWVHMWECGPSLSADIVGLACMDHIGHDSKLYESEFCLTWSHRACCVDSLAETQHEDSHHCCGPKSIQYFHVYNILCTFRHTFLLIHLDFLIWFPYSHGCKNTIRFTPNIISSQHPSSHWEQAALLPAIPHPISVHRSNCLVSFCCWTITYFSVHKWKSYSIYQCVTIRNRRMCVCLCVSCTIRCRESLIRNLSSLIWLEEAKEDEGN